MNDIRMLYNLFNMPVGYCYVKHLARILDAEERNKKEIPYHKRHKWCNHPEHLHCVICGKYKE